MTDHPTGIADVLTDAIERVSQELTRQDQKWGSRNHDVGTWRFIIGEEDGEVDAAILQGRIGDAQGELVQAIACRIRLYDLLGRLAGATPAID